MRQGMDEICPIQWAANQGQCCPDALSAALDGPRPGALISRSDWAEHFSGVPALGADVPLILQPGRPDSEMVRLALALLDCGVVAPAECIAEDEDCAAFVTRVLTAWCGEITGNLRWFSPLLNMRIHIDEEGATYLLRLQETVTQQLTIGPAMSALEAQARGLGRAVLHAIDCQSSYPIFTPTDARVECECMFWQGEDSEEGALQYAEDEQEREEMLDGMITQAMFNTAYPEWMRKAGAFRLKGAGLRAVAAQGGYAGDVAQALVALGQRRAHTVPPRHMAGGEYEKDVHNGKFPEEDGYFIGWGVLLHWTDADGDLGRRVFDDLYNMAMQGECYDSIGTQRIREGDTVKLRRWFGQMRRHLDVIGRLDSLLTLLADPY